MSAKKKTFPRTQLFLLGLLLIGDLVVTLAGFTLAYVLRFWSPLRLVGVQDPFIRYHDYFPLLVVSVIVFVGIFAFQNLYDGRLLLRPHRASSIIFRVVAFILLVFLCTSSVFKVEPSVSRLFAVISCGTIVAVLIVWRLSFYLWLSKSRFRRRLIQKIVIVGWNAEATQLLHAIRNDKNHPYSVVGVVTPSGVPATDFTVPDRPRHLGSVDNLPRLLRRPLIDMVIVADLNLTKDQLIGIAGICEETYTDFKIIPSFFQIFLSSLKLQSVSGVPIMGVEELPIRRFQNVIIKRITDVIGAFVGIGASVPIVAILAVLIRRESPGPIIYRQRRTGLHGRPFYIYKLRSMRMDAESNTGARWATSNDPRRTRIGAFMRETNLDELPQFWNVLMGDMSLVGPRPERPELISRFQTEIPHYNPRHEVRPGITGWAQVNGFRGDTSLSERIKHDLYYIENWSLWLDIQIMLLTFTRRNNAY